MASQLAIGKLRNTGRWYDRRKKVELDQCASSAVIKTVTKLYHPHRGVPSTQMSLPLVHYRILLHASMQAVSPER